MKDNQRAAVGTDDLAGLLRLLLPVTEPFLERLCLLDLLSLLVRKFLPQTKDEGGCKPVLDCQQAVFMTKGHNEIGTVFPGKRIEGNGLVAVFTRLQLPLLSQESTQMRVLFLSEFLLVVLTVLLNESSLILFIFNLCLTVLFRKFLKESVIFVLHSAETGINAVSHIAGIEVTHQVGIVTKYALTFRDIGTDMNASTTHALDKSVTQDSIQRKNLLHIIHGTDDLLTDAFTRTYQFSNTALDGPLAQLRIFKLVTDGDTLTGTDKLREIGIKGMMRETGHPGTVLATPGKGDPENAGALCGILLVALIEVAAPEQKDRIGMLGLQVMELPHDGGHLRLYAPEMLRHSIEIGQSRLREDSPVQPQDVISLLLRTDEAEGRNLPADL